MNENDFITPEILEELGFIKFRTNNEMTLPIIEIGEDSLNITVYSKELPLRLFLEQTGRNDDYVPQFTSIVIDEIKTVSQLRALYRALTGKEL